MSADNYALVFKKNDVYRVAILKDSCHSPLTVDFATCMENLLDKILLFPTEESAEAYYLLAEENFAQNGIMLTEYGLLSPLRDFDA